MITKSYQQKAVVSNPKEVSEQQSEVIPIKSKITTKEFENRVLHRMKAQEKKKTEKIEYLLKQKKEKIEKSISPVPKTNHNIKIPGGFYDRLKNDEAKRNFNENHEYERRIWLDPEIREQTFSPNINKKSNNLHRSINELFYWEEKRRTKLMIQQKEKTEIDYDFNPSIKSGLRTPTKYLDKSEQQRWENRHAENTISPERLKEIRANFCPKINKRSRNIVEKMDRSRDCYKEGTINQPGKVKTNIKSHYKKGKKSQGNKENSIEPKLKEQQEQMNPVELAPQNKHSQKHQSKNFYHDIESVQQSNQKSLTKDNSDEIPTITEVTPARKEDITGLTATPNDEEDLSFHCAKIKTPKCDHNRGSQTPKRIMKNVQKYTPIRNSTNQQDVCSQNEKIRELLKKDNNDSQIALAIEDKYNLPEAYSVNEAVYNAMVLNSLSPSRQTPSNSYLEVPLKTRGHSPIYDEARYVYKSSNKKKKSKKLKSMKKKSPREYNNQIECQGFDVNPNFNYERAMNIAEENYDKNNKDRYITNHGRCHGYGSYDFNTGFPENPHEKYIEVLQTGDNNYVIINPEDKQFVENLQNNYEAKPLKKHRKTRAERNKNQSNNAKDGFRDEVKETQYDNDLFYTRTYQANKQTSQEEPEPIEEEQYQIETQVTQTETQVTQNETNFIGEGNLGRNKFHNISTNRQALTKQMHEKLHLENSVQLKNMSFQQRQQSNWPDDSTIEENVILPHNFACMNMMIYDHQDIMINCDSKQFYVQENNNNKQFSNEQTNRTKTINSGINSNLIDNNSQHNRNDNKSYSKSSYKSGRSMLNKQRKENMNDNSPDNVHKHNHMRNLEKFCNKYLDASLVNCKEENLDKVDSMAGNDNKHKIPYVSSSRREKMLIVNEVDQIHQSFDETGGPREKNLIEHGSIHYTEESIKKEVNMEISLSNIKQKISQKSAKNQKCVTDRPTGSVSIRKKRNDLNCQDGSSVNLKQAKFMKDNDDKLHAYVYKSRSIDLIGGKSNQTRQTKVKPKRKLDNCGKWIQERKGKEIVVNKKRPNDIGININRINQEKINRQKEIITAAQDLLNNINEVI